MYTEKSLPALLITTPGKSSIFILPCPDLRGLSCEKGTVVKLKKN